MIKNYSNPKVDQPPSNDSKIGNHNGNNMQPSNPKDSKRLPSDKNHKIDTETHLVKNGKGKNIIEPSCNEKKQKMFVQLISNGFSINQIQAILTNYFGNSENDSNIGNSNNVWSKSTLR
eukprot:397186_1